MDNLNAQIVDQRVRGIMQDRPDLLSCDSDENKNLATAFVLLAVQCVLDCDLEQAAECLTDGANVFAVDAIHI